MRNRAKEKSNLRNTKDKNILDLDNEIIIGIKSLPKVPKQKRTNQQRENKKNEKQKQSKKSVVPKKKTRKEQNTHVTQKKQVKKKIKEDDIELRLGIED